MNFLYLWRMEALRFARNPVHIWIVAGFVLLLVISALWAGTNASQWRERMAASQVAGQAAVSRALEDSLSHDAQNAAASPMNTLQAIYYLLAPRLQLPLQGGLALSVRQADLLGPEIKVSAGSRYTDGRNSDQIANPQLLELGLLDFATVLALLLPLAVIGLGYGLVQEDRERGIWRLVCAQMRRPWTLVAAALSVRFLAVWLPAVLASILAFALDSGATLAAAWQWLVFVTAFAAFWTLLAALFVLLPIGTGAAALGMLGLWLATTFAVPPALGWMAQRADPMPARLQAVVEIRKLQHEADENRMRLQAAWLDAHPEHRPLASAMPLKWPADRLPATLEMEKALRPLMLAFDEARSRQVEFMERWSWLSPGLGAVLVADRLAGIDAPAYLAYTKAVNAFEDEWRAYFVPRIMAGTKLQPAELERLPVFDYQSSIDSGATWRMILSLSLLCAVLGAVLLLARHRIGKP